MCGVAGIVDVKGEREIDRAALARMTAALAHRGPDGEGFFFAPGIGFGHRRLAIIDIEGGAQPFIASDRKSVLAFNGEIYNYRALGAEQATPRRTNSDTEIVAEGLLAAGAAYLQRLRGMFAFGFWSARDETLLLGRDRIGERPLYYAETPEGFLVFASEIGAIAAAGLVSLDIDQHALADYFLYGCVPDPKSIYTRVRKLPPASVLTIRRGGRAEISAYWRPDFTPRVSKSLEEEAEDLNARLDEAAGLELLSEVPIGAFLSAGIDSTAVVAAAARAKPDLSTFTVGFDDPAFDERAAAAEIAAHLGAPHTEETASIEAAALIDDIARGFGEPFADSSALPSYVVARLARTHVTVALSGDGGDELFSGYRRHGLFALEEAMRRHAPGFLRAPLFGAAGALYPKLDWAPRRFRLKTTLQALALSSPDAYALAIAANRPDRLKRLLSRDHQRGLDGYDPRRVVSDALTGLDAPPAALPFAADLKVWLPGRMLTKVDRMAMAHGLEVRPPLLDYRLVEWAAGLDPALKRADGEGKLILRRAVAPRAPASVLSRPKQGFAPPLSRWLKAPSGPIDRLTTSRRWRDSGVINASVVDKMIAAHRQGASDFAQELWTVIMYDAFLATTPRRGAPF